MLDILCSDPLHDTRSNEVGWSAILGTVPDDETPPSGMYCAACAVYLLQPIPNDAGSYTMYEPSFQEEVYDARGLLQSRIIYAKWEGSAFSQPVEELTRMYTGNTLLTETVRKFAASGDVIWTRTWSFSVVQEGPLRRIRKVVT